MPPLSAAIQSLIADPAHRKHLADAGFDRLHAHFAMDSSINDLDRRFRADLG